MVLSSQISNFEFWLPYLTFLAKNFHYMFCRCFSMQLGKKIFFFHTIPFPYAEINGFLSQNNFVIPSHRKIIDFIIGKRDCMKKKNFFAKLHGKTSTEHIEKVFRQKSQIRQLKLKITDLG